VWLIEVVFFYFVITPSPCFMPLCLMPFCINATVSLHHFLICALSFTVDHPLAGCILLRELFISDGNIVFDLCWLFQTWNFDIKYGLGIYIKPRIYVWFCWSIYAKHVCIQNNRYCSTENSHTVHEVLLNDFDMGLWCACNTWRKIELFF
jgi:hypothetical protein